jgi:hypothetical protein
MAPEPNSVGSHKWALRPAGTDTAEQNKVKLVGREDILSLGAIARELMNGQ